MTHVTIFAAIHHMTVGLAPSLLVIGEAFAALGYMWRSWSGHPLLNAEAAQGQGMTLVTV